MRGSRGAAHGLRAAVVDRWIDRLGAALLPQQLLQLLLAGLAAVAEGVIVFGAEDQEDRDKIAIIRIVDVLPVPGSPVNIILGIHLCSIIL